MFQKCHLNSLSQIVTNNLRTAQSEHIGQWATPHHLSDVRRGAPSWIWDYLAHSDVTICVQNATWHDRRLGGIGRVVPIAHCFVAEMAAISKFRETNVKVVSSTNLCHHR